MKLRLGLAAVALFAVSSASAVNENSSSFSNSGSSQTQQKQTNKGNKRNKEEKQRDWKVLSFGKKYVGTLGQLISDDQRDLKFTGVSAIAGNLAMIYTVYRSVKWMFGSKKRHHHKKS